MTRINVGVDPSELCDQHLVAEYRELPRLWNFQSKSLPPAQFKLGSGHVRWCAQYPGMLADRYVALVAEMLSRGFSVSYPEAPSGTLQGLRPSDTALQAARPIVLGRLAEKYKTMKRPPRWTTPRDAAVDQGVADVAVQPDPPRPDWHLMSGIIHRQMLEVEDQRGFAYIDQLERRCPEVGGDG